ncbi:hypothetical protein [Aurantimonas sp. A3-2-R12]|uniref:hypothetical protein n=1 Tax=Aurantimonas sp. A3-2-R12 TaxID=3114362 RepID=UPI002E18ADBA|nr:hypothetical protein [Aurantimonas sp. A3-2-R12]
MRSSIFGSALSLVVSAAVAQDFGGQEDRDSAGQLAQNMRGMMMGGADCYSGDRFPRHRHRLFRPRITSVTHSPFHKGRAMISTGSIID